MPDSIEGIILDRDRRGISALAPHLPGDFCDQAAALVLEHPGTAMIVTGFYILAAGAAETDGPPGAIAIGRALASIGYEVVHATDRYAEPLLSAIVGDEAAVEDQLHQLAEVGATDLLATIFPVDGSQTSFTRTRAFLQGMVGNV